MATNTPDTPKDDAAANGAPAGQPEAATPAAAPTASKRRGRPNMRMNSKTSPAAIERLERDLANVNLRRSGVAWDAIATQLGYADAGHAHRRFMAVMAAYPREDVDQARQVELDRLDQIQHAIWAQCLDTESKNQHWAIDRMLKLSDQRARLLGLNAPVRQEISVLSESVVDKAIRELQAQMQAQASEAGVELPAE
jgi:hypothetical protein